MRSEKEQKEARKVQLATHARFMRWRPTESEARLWEHLRGSRLGVGFRRQFVIGRFVVDFASPKARLVVEVDGGYRSRTLLLARELRGGARCPGHETREADALGEQIRRFVWPKEAARQAGGVKQLPE